MHDDNCKLWILRDASTPLMFALSWEVAPVCVHWHVLRWLLLHVCIWTETSHQWLFTHRQGVVESMLHICIRLAPCSDKNNILHWGGWHAKLLYGNLHVYMSVSIFWERQSEHDLQNVLTLWDGSSHCGLYIILQHFLAPQHHSLMTALNLSHMFSIGRLGLKVKVE